MTTLSLPFAHLNLRRNPFGELTVEERAALAVANVETLVPRLRAGAQVQFVGAQGRGKTSHLLALKARLPEAHYVRCDRDGPAPYAPILLLDEADRVPRGACALAVHRPLRGVEIIELPPLTPARLATIIERRIEHVRRNPGPVPRVMDVEELIARFGDDVRAIEHHLYERFQGTAHHQECD